MNLSENLQFIAIYIALYESFSDYVISCPKQLLDGERIIRSDLTDTIKEVELQHKKLKQKARNLLENESKYKLNPETLEKIRTIANYDYIKYTEDGYTSWLSPDYDRIINKRELVVNGKKQKNTLFNSIMFFVDNNVIEKEDFDTFLQIRELRNKLVHEMAKLMLIPTEENWRDMFEQLIRIYKRINNYWCVDFECSIAGEDMPTDISIDYDNIITVELYNILLAIDLMFNSKLVLDKKCMFLRGLYTSIYIPINGEESKFE